MRLTRDAWALELACATAKRSTCCRRAVGCVLLDQHGYVLATGYNGVAAGQLHCNERLPGGMVLKDGAPLVRLTDVEARERIVAGELQPEDVYPAACAGAFMASGTGLELCEAIHAEQNALLQCRDAQAIRTCYVTASPCVTCVKLLLNTGCLRIVYRDEYPHPAAKDLWHRAGRVWERLWPAASARVDERSAS